MARKAPRSAPTDGARRAARDSDRGGLDQTCPRCGITVHVRSPALAVRYCPHCVARAHVATPMPMAPRTAA
jgi:hypothetical protein